MKISKSQSDDLELKQRKLEDLNNMWTFRLITFSTFIVLHYHLKHIHLDLNGQHGEDSKSL